MVFFYLSLRLYYVFLTLTFNISLGLFLNCGLSNFSINEYCISMHKILHTETTSHHAVLLTIQHPLSSVCMFFALIGLLLLAQ